VGPSGWRRSGIALDMKSMGGNGKMEEVPLQGKKTPSFSRRQMAPPRCGWSYKLCCSITIHRESKMSTGTLVVSDVPRSLHDINSILFLNQHHVSNIA
jgi:hypothetical protein